MKVKDLIAILENYPEGSTVVIENPIGITLHNINSAFDENYKDENYVVILPEKDGKKL